MTALELPPRYEPMSRLGKGGGGEVWAVRDRHTGQPRALKVLAEDATESEMNALVREAVTLSGLEGLGVPRVLLFGRLPRDGRPFMVRELVEGRSLAEWIDERTDSARCFDALAAAAEQLTLLHRAGLLHGDVKPANVIVEDGGRATLVDLGLAAPFRTAGTVAEGLTPKYAAPELFEGKPLTVRAEIYALGVALREVIDAFDASLNAMRDELRSVATRATAARAEDRFPSADEFAIALRRAAKLGEPAASWNAPAELWPIVGTESIAERLLATVRDLADGQVLSIRGAPGSGRSVLLRRLAWSLGVEGRPLVWIDDVVGPDAAALQAEFSGAASMRGITLLVDDLERVATEGRAALLRARTDGARLVVVGELGPGPVFDVPPLSVHASLELVRRALPSLTDRLARRLVDRCEGRPGELRRFVRRAARRAVASERDLEDLVNDFDEAASVLPGDSLAQAVSLLDRGRYTDARCVLEVLRDADELELAIAWARIEFGIGSAQAARDRLLGVSELASARAGSPAASAWAVCLGRAQVGLGDYASALELLDAVSRGTDAFAAEALAYRGLALAYTGDQASARGALDEAVSRAAALGSKRIEALANSCLGSVLQRADDAVGARAAYERAISAAEEAGDAGVLGTAHLNLACLLKISGDIAGAMERFEAAVDMGRRSGRLATLRQALLNLANTDLYLGRLARARTSIDALGAQRQDLPRAAQAQLLGLEAELASRTDETARAASAYAACADAYAELGRFVDSAEARLEGVLVAARAGDSDPDALTKLVERAGNELRGSHAHRPLLALARASVAWASRDEQRARKELTTALDSAREATQREFVWRALEVRSEIADVSEQPVSARRDREEALAVLEEIAARLPRDLREVFWNDPRRRRLRALVAETLGAAPTRLQRGPPAERIDFGSGTSSIASLTTTPLERRLARILEVNAELLTEVDLGRLAARVTDHAVDMLRAERGFVLLRDASGALAVHTSRARVGDPAHAEFSRSVAERVVLSGEPIVAVNAKGDARFLGTKSVHVLPLESVACVPIRARAGDAIGALYVETRLRAGFNFERELPTLQAFADQVGIALETTTLLRENADRADALHAANEELKKAQAELKELLGDRTAQLRRARQKLRDARDTLYGHFGYQGLVGTSAAMRRVYALIERIKEADVPVLITGESGTGKELAARAIHRASSRAELPFFGLNCAAVPEHLLESELFGHTRGAFTGADRERKGLFREAHGGTLLLDEIGEMPQRMQTSLLRVLQERKVRPVGGNEEQNIDVRLMFATHRDLESMVRAGTFREDLFYRIHVVILHLPPLRERTEDIAPLVDYFLGIFAARYKRDKRSVSLAALRRLAAFDWPGNVRQLEHVLLNAWVLSDEPVLAPEDFDLPEGQTFPRPVDSAAPREVRARPGDVAGVPGRPPKKPASERAHRTEGASDTASHHRRDERERILDALRASNWNRAQAARLSGIPRRTFYRRLREYGIQ